MGDETTSTGGEKNAFDNANLRLLEALSSDLYFCYLYQVRCISSYSPSEYRSKVFQGDLDDPEWPTWRPKRPSPSEVATELAFRAGLRPRALNKQEFRLPWTLSNLKFSGFGTRWTPNDQVSIWMPGSCTSLAELGRKGMTVEQALHTFYAWLGREI